MPPQTLQFGDLPGIHCALVDMGSLGALLSPAVMDFLEGKSHFQSWLGLWKQFEPKLGPRVTAGIVLRQAKEDPVISAALSILDRFVTHEYIIFDKVTFEGEFSRGIFNISTFERLQKEAEFLLPVEVPQDVYIRTRKAILTNQQAISEIKKGLQPYDFDGGDKAVHDILFELPKWRQFSFADSGDVPERALFYAMIAEKAQAPMLVTRNKAMLLRKFGFLLTQFKAPRKGVHEHIEDFALEASLGPSATFSEPIPLPPIAEQIFLSSLRENVPPINKLMELRNTHEAVEYRKFVFQLEKLTHGSISERAEVARSLEDIQKHVNAWVIDPNVGIKYKLRTIKLDKLPLVGWVFDSGGASEIKIKDPLLTTTPAYLRFISGWFHPQQG